MMQLFIGWILLVLIHAGENKNLHTVSSLFSSNDSEMNEIRRMYDQLDDVILKHLLGSVDVGRTRRDAEFPFNPTTTCTLSEEELNALLSLLTNTTRSMRSIAESNNDITLQDPSCSQLPHIKNGINKLIIQFDTLMNNQYIGADYLEQKRVYENEIRDLKKQMDDMHRDQRQIYKTEVDRMLSIFQQLKNKMNETLRKYEDEKKQHKEAKIQICILQIITSQFNSAHQTFQELNDAGQLDRIVTSVYGKSKSHGENILVFLGKLTISQSGSGYLTLFEEMKKHSHLDSPQVLQLEYQVSTLTSSSSLNSPIVLLLKAMTRALAPYVKNLLNTWGGNIRSRYFDQIKQFAKNTNTDFDNRLPKLISFAFNGNVHNYENVKDFIDGLGNLQQWSIGYRSLFEEMEKANEFNSNEIIRLGIKMKYVLGFNSLSQLERDRLTSLKQRFPSSIQNIVWTERASIYNTYFNEYLYADEDNKARSSERRSVYTWIVNSPRSSWYVNSWAWILEPIADGKYFLIKNHPKNEYLFNDNDRWVRCGKRRSVFSWRQKGRTVDGSEWFLEPIDGGQRVRIRNKLYNEYLFAEDASWAPDRRRRSVYTWRTKGVPVAKGVWVIGN